MPSLSRPRSDREIDRSAADGILGRDVITLGHGLDLDGRTVVTGLETAVVRTPNQEDRESTHNEELLHRLSPDSNLY